MQISWLSLIPPLTVMVTALITKNINRALILSIITAVIIAAKGNALEATYLLGERLWIQLIDLQKWYLYLFLIATATFITLFEKTGCASYLAFLARSHIRSGKSIQTSSLIISTTLFIDDYLSILTTGFIMSPLASHFGIAREKIAFLVHTMAGPIVILAPISSWLATITAYMAEAGVHSINQGAKTRIIADPFYLYLQTVPFIFYAIIMVISTWFIVRNRISYGPMYGYEKAAEGNLMEDHHINSPKATTGSLADLMIPMTTLLSTMFTGILYSGNYHLLGGTASLVEAIQQSNNLFFIMFISSLTALSISLTRALHKKVIKIADIAPLIVQGYKIMQGAIYMVLLASILGYLLKNDLQTGSYLAHTLLQQVSITYIPLVFFGVSLIITVSTGSAWATFAIMLPIAIPMITANSSSLPVTIHDLPILLPLLGAIFSGAVMGDHLSPLSETTVMTATCTKTSPLTHAYTQVWYAIPAIIGTIIALLCAGNLIAYPWWTMSIISIGAGTITSLTLLVSAHHLYHHHHTRYINALSKIHQKKSR